MCFNSCACASGRRAQSYCRAACPRRALMGEPGREITAIGTVSMIACQSFHFGSCKRLSAPIIKTKLLSAWRVLSVRKRSTVYCVPYCRSTSLTRIRGGRGRSRTVLARISQLGCSGLSGFCGLTSHQISSNCNVRKPALATWR